MMWWMIFSLIHFKVVSLFVLVNILNTFMEEYLHISVVMIITMREMYRSIRLAISSLISELLLELISLPNYQTLKI